MSLSKHIIKVDNTVKEALEKLNILGLDAILFIVSHEDKLIGSITDGDIRRGLLKDLSLNDEIVKFIQPNPKFIYKNNFDIKKIIELRNQNLKIIPVLDENNKIVQIVNFRLQKSYLPADAVIMAGGKGERLKPLTNNTPKPLLKVGNKTIIEHNIDNLIKFGIDDFHISLGYLGNQIKDYLGNGENKSISINYTHEEKPLGTIGALKNIHTFANDYILLSNSDILTTLNYEDFFVDFLDSQADISIFSIPYTVNIPLGVFEIKQGNEIKSIHEKPSYTYYSNSGIYLMKKELINLIPENTFFNATDFIELCIANNKKVISHNSSAYWLDIGTPNDFEKAQIDILHLGL